MRILGAVLCLVFLTGCPSALTHADPVLVHDRMPELSLPDRPKLEKMTSEELTEYTKLPEPVRTKLQSNNERLMIYADQCVETLKEYNGFSKLTNQRNGLWIKGGLKDEPVPGK